MNIPTVPTSELAQKTIPGAFWHLEAQSRRRGFYVRTRCGRRLAQWHLAAPVPVSHVDVGDMCAGCVRKVSEG